MSDLGFGAIIWGVGVRQESVTLVALSKGLLRQAVTALPQGSGGAADSNRWGSPTHQVQDAAECLPSAPGPNPLLGGPTELPRKGTGPCSVSLHHQPPAFRGPLWPHPREPCYPGALGLGPWLERSRWVGRWGSRCVMLLHTYRKSRHTSQVCHVTPVTRQTPHVAGTGS